MTTKKIPNISAMQNLKVSEVFELANSYHVKGQFDQAEQLYKQILKSIPNQPVALHLLGVLNHQRGKHKEATRLINKALKHKPDYADAHSNLGLVYKHEKKYEKAAKHFQQAIKIIPSFVEAHTNLGITYALLNQNDRAITCFTQALSLKPDYIAALYNLGGMYLKENELQKALACYQKAASINAEYPDLRKQLGLAYLKVGDFADAVNVLALAVNQQDQDVQSHFYLARAMQMQADIANKPALIDQAAHHYMKAIELQPDYIDAINQLAILYEKSGQLGKSVEYYEKSLILDQKKGDVCNNLGNVYQKMGDYVNAIASYEKALKIEPADLYYSNLLLTLHYDTGIDAQYIYQRHLDWSKKYELPKENLDLNRRNHKRLRIGYLSPDFRTHSVAYFFMPLLMSHDSDQFEIYCYQINAKVDEMTCSLKKCSEHWRDISTSSTQEAVKKITDDEIDILVDLAGHTSKTSLSIMARKPAPIQVTWLGYPNTTGLRTVDYRLTDEVADPTGISDSINTETLVRLPGGFLCYQGDESVTYQKVLPKTRKGHMTFGSFNNLTKINDDVVTLWAKILSEVQGSKLLLKSHQLQDASVRDNLTRKFEKHGIEKERLSLYASLPKKEDHLKLYEEIDVALDTFPYNGVTTTCEALWMGVPTITLQGNSHVARVASSIMKHAGLENFVAIDAAQYVEIAKSLANETQYLSAIRENMRDHVKSSDLFNSKQFALNVENTYDDIWKKKTQIS